MYISRSFRGIASLCRRYPKVDRITLPKGGNSGNVYTFQRVHKLIPFISFDGSYPSIRDQRWVNGIICNSTIHVAPFTTSKVILNQNTLSQNDLKRAVDNLTDQFMETRELLGDAKETIGTVYFSDDMKDAKDALKKTLDDYQDLLDKLTDQQKKEVVRTIGLKMKELEAHYQALMEESNH